MSSKKILLAICMGIIIPILVPTALAEEDNTDRDYMYVMFVNSTDSRYSNSFAYTTVTTAIYSTVQYPAVISIYVQDADMTPIGVAIFKTTLLEGVTPIEYGFTIPIECYYNTYDHKPICNTDTPKTVYVNIFTDSSLTEPLTSEAIGTTMV